MTTQITMEDLRKLDQRNVNIGIGIFIVTVIISITISLISLSSNSEKSITTGPQIKGFYLGMSHDEVINLLTVKYSTYFGKEPLDVFYKSNNTYSYSNGKKQYYRSIDEYLKNTEYKNTPVNSIVIADLTVEFYENKVILFKITDDLTDFLFKSKGFSGKEFVQQFINSYNIPEMKTEEVTKNGVTREYFLYSNREKGYAIKIINSTHISERITILMAEIKKLSETKFGD